MKRIPRPGNAEESIMMYPWEALSENRILHLLGPIAGPWGLVSRNDMYSPEVISQSMIILDSVNHDPIKLVIDSPGGLIDVGLSFYNVMQSLKSPVYTIGKNCCSMAAILFATGASGHRYLYPFARIMLHLPRAGFQGDPRELEIYLAEFQKDKETLVNLLIKHGCKKNREQILADIDRDFYLSDQGVIDYGLADHVITPDIHQQLFGNLTFPDFEESQKSKSPRKKKT